MENIKKIAKFLILCNLCCSVYGQLIPSESDFFTGTVGPRTFTVPLPVTANKIMTAIDSANTINRGGTVIIPEGRHSINRPITLKSNVHIEIDPNAVFVPTRPMRAVFSIGRDEPAVKITNVRIYSSSNSGERYTIDYSGSNFTSNNIRAFHFGYVQNFEISDFLVRDNRSIQAAVHLVPNTAGGNTTTSFNQRPNQGVIKNGNTTGADFGYGLVQIGSARNILLKNISGTGGITLRIEGSFDELAQAGRANGRTLNIFAENVRCRNGQAAVMTQPHTKVMGRVLVRNVTSINCATGIRFSRGFSRFGIAPGFCRPIPHIGGRVVIRRIGGLQNRSAQIRAPFHLYYPVDFFRNNPLSDFELVRADGRARKAPAIVPIAHFSRQNINNVGSNSEGFYDFLYTPTNNGGVITGFDCTPDIVNSSDIRNVCGNSRKVLGDDNVINESLTITSNNKTLTIAAVTKTSVTIYNLNGNLIKESTVKSGVSNIELPTLSTGIYIVKALSAIESKTQKIIIN